MLAQSSAINIETPLDGPANMALDREILAGANDGVPGWRLYTWDGPWVSLGRSQDPRRDLKPGISVPWVMRPTGGRAVLHGHDLTLSLAVPLAALTVGSESGEALSRSVRTVYRRLCAPIIEGLRRAGVAAVLGEETRLGSGTMKSADCFAHVSPNDIVDSRSGVKACGVALQLTAQAVLVQASIPCIKPLVYPAAVFSEPGETRWLGVSLASLARALDASLCTEFGS